MDALTYGLATLVMREDLFENVMLAKDDPNHAVCHNYSCTKCGMINHVPKAYYPSKSRKLRRGNYFSQFTKKFSLGNGPADWVQEYLVTKESGKMLGTLVALSLARMPNLESFVWDMPTGILRDIWISLSSLGDYQPSKLAKVWVRFHNNELALQDAGLHYPVPTRQSNMNLPHSSIPLVSMPSYKKLKFSSHPTEHPNFSTLPPLRSLTVLAIDEIAYLEEISVLIGRSRDKIRELRIGLASLINTSGYDGDHASVQCFAAGTEIALLLNSIHDSFDPRSENYLYKPKTSLPEAQSTTMANEAQFDPAAPDSQSPSSSRSPQSGVNITLPDEFSNLVPDGIFSPSEPDTLFTYKADPDLDSSIDPALPHGPHATAFGELGATKAVQYPGLLTEVSPGVLSGAPAIEQSEAEPSSISEDSQAPVPRLTIPTRQLTDPEAADSKLKLETLELEGCIINVFVLTKSIDFSILTSLTLLHCEGSDMLWSDLSRQYPTSAANQKSLVVSIPTQTSDNVAVQNRLRRTSTIENLAKELKYTLKLKRIHTDTVSSSLISFLSKTLAPNSLEHLFLQDNPAFVSPVTIDAIYKGPLRRHRASLTKIMIDSSTGASGSRSRTTSALKWMLSRDFLTFVTSGKMSKLRELAMVVEYKDWHFFLQRLPNIPHLRSLYVPYIVNHVYGNGLNVRDLAMGVVDVVTLRPEVELCYLGISTKCFEILEKKHKAKRKDSTISAMAASSEDTDEDSGNDDYNPSEDDDEDDDGGLPTPVTSSPVAVTAEDDAADDDDAISSDEEVEGPAVKKLKYKLREILFYDDKISIFKARHGRL